MTGTPAGSPLPENLACNYSRITEDFCPDCTYKCKDSKDCQHLSYGNGVCLSFVWISDARRAVYEAAVFRNWAVTAWISKGKSFEEINSMANADLLSILTKAQLRYFDKPKFVPEVVKVDTASTSPVPLVDTPAPSKSVAAIPSTEKSAGVYRDLLGNPICSKGEKKTMNITPLSPLPVRGTVTTTKATTPRADCPAKAPPPVAPVPVVIQDPVAVPVQATSKDVHLFHCQKSDGTQVTYKRNMHSSSYVSEVVSFKKYLAKSGIVILSETFESAEAK